MLLTHVAKKLKTNRSTLLNWIEKYELQAFVIRRNKPLEINLPNATYTMNKLMMEIPHPTAFKRELNRRKKAYKEYITKLRISRKYWKALYRICFAQGCSCTNCDNKEICNYSKNKMITTPMIKVEVLETFAKYGAPIKEDAWRQYLKERKSNCNYASWPTKSQKNTKK